MKRLRHRVCSTALLIPPPGCPHPERDSGEEPSSARESSEEGPGLNPGHCRLAERALLVDEEFERWPSPRALAKAMNHTYVGKVVWNDLGTDIDPPDEILVDVDVDFQAIKLRYVTEYPGPGNRDICTSALIIPIRVVIRLGGSQVEIERNQVSYDEIASISKTLPSSFAGAFGQQTEARYDVGLEVGFDGRVVSGWFELRSATDYRRVGTFLAR